MPVKAADILNISGAGQVCEAGVFFRIWPVKLLCRPVGALAAKGRNFAMRYNSRTMLKSAQKGGSPLGGPPGLYYLILGRAT